MRKVALEGLVSNTIDCFFDNLKEFGWQSCQKSNCVRKWWKTRTPEEKYEISSKLLDIAENVDKI